jgi:hypothetical protein
VCNNCGAIVSVKPMFCMDDVALLTQCFTHISLGEIPVFISLENLSISRASTLYDHVLSLTCYLFHSSTTHGCVYK